MCLAESLGSPPLPSGKHTRSRDGKITVYTSRGAQCTRSLRSNLHCLFTHQRHTNIGVKNTTNALDGGVFSPMKTLLRIHRGMRKSLKIKLIVDYLENH